jgi:hypothetical protein
MVRDVSFPQPSVESHQARSLFGKDWILVFQSLQLSDQWLERLNRRGSSSSWRDCRDVLLCRRFIAVGDTADWEVSVIPVCQSHLACCQGLAYLGRLLLMGVCVLPDLTNIAVSGASSVAGGLALALDRPFLNTEFAHGATLSVEEAWSWFLQAPELTQGRPFILPEPPINFD